jgi:hypothetical protein
MGGMSPRVTVTIDELSLSGVPPFQRFALAAALEAELARLLAERGAPPGLLAGAAPVPQPVDPTGLGPREMGRAVARSLYEGWR